jgi:hypothetical protein
MTFNDQTKFFIETNFITQLFWITIMQILLMLLLILTQNQI